MHKKSSNHTPQIIKQLPKIISDRLSKIFSNEDIFDESKGEYEDVLKQSGSNNINLKYQALITFNTKQKRRRNIIWFNPPFSRDVSTNVAKKFLQFLEKHFRPSNSLHKIFNRNTIKVSYCCTQKLDNIIKLHNKEQISSNSPILSCNCIKEECPLEGKHKTNDVVYKCIASGTGKELHKESLKNSFTIIIRL